MQSLVKPDDLLRWTWQIYPNRTDSDAETFSFVHSHDFTDASQKSKAMQLFRKLSLFKDKTVLTNTSEKATSHPLVIPMACVYTPLRSYHAFEEPRHQLQVKPWLCIKCGASLNAYCEQEQDKDGNVSRWVCVFCRSVNIVKSNLIKTLSISCPPDFQEYVILDESPRTPIDIHCFVMDASITVRGLGNLTEKLLGALQLLPPDAYIMLITYAEMVCIWELTDSGVANCVALPADQYFSEAEICRYLEMTPGTCASMLSSKYIVPVVDADFMITTVLQNAIACEGGGIGPSVRPKRCTGSAIHITTSLLGVLMCPHVKSSVSTQYQCVNAYSVEMHVFIGGRITKGLGMPVEVKKDFIASAKDVAVKSLQFDRSKNEIDAFDLRLKQFFDTISCVTLNLFVCSQDTVEIENLQPFASQSGGTVFLHESFSAENFEETLRRHFAEHYYNRTVFDVTHTIYTTSDTLLAGCIGPCRRIPRSEDFGPVSFQSASFNDESTLTLYFEPKLVQLNTLALQSSQIDYNCHSSRIFQFHTTFSTRTGERFIRITTSRKGVGPYIQKDMRSLPFYIESGGFDQNTAFIVTAKYIAHSILCNNFQILKTCQFELESLDDMKASQRKKQNNKEVFSAVKAFTESILISFYRMFASKISEPPVNFDAFPRLCYHLLRSNIFQNFNISVDEQQFHFSHLNKHDVETAIRMIVPSLIRFACDSIENLKGIPVPLDSRLLQKDSICLIDAYFEVIIYFGSNVDQWRQHNFHLNPEYAAFAKLLHEVEVRFELLNKQYKMAPFLIRCVEGDSKSRFASNLMSEIVPPYLTDNGSQIDERNSLGAFCTACRQRVFGPRRN